MLENSVPRENWSSKENGKDGGKKNGEGLEEEVGEDEGNKMRRTKLTWIQEEKRRFNLG
jgi:hypothetical protein